MRYGLTDTQIKQIRRVLSQTLRVERAVLFGSRAKGTFKPGSDIDLALLGNALAFSDLLSVDNALEELDLPYTFDLVLYHQINDPAVRSHIDRVGITLYSCDSQKVISKNP